jgi:hypothetical protein
LITTARPERSERRSASEWRPPKRAAERSRREAPTASAKKEAMRQLREQDFGCALQFGNYRG